ncbi:MAG: polyprenol monophosphomannose synthase [Flavobacteriales bacterium]|nr:polyprenol monophosphomannose synthase [Flavobacteriales bacterium]
MSDTLVIIPTYNEKENIAAIIQKVFSLRKDFEILVVDDNSPDGTSYIVEELIAEYAGELHILKRKGKNGLGTAYIAGFKWALERKYEYMIEMDADFSHNPEDLERLYNACKVDGAEVSIGSRYVQGVNVVNWPMKRVLLSYFASKYVKVVTSLPLNDATAGFVCYNRIVLETINLDKIRFVGYAFQIEMKFKAWKFKFKIKEVPVIFTDRTLGESKMSKSIMTEAIFGIINMKFRSFFQDYKR